MQRPRFKRLSTQIYVTILVALMAVVITSGIMWRRASNSLPIRQAFEVAGELVATALPATGATRTATDAELKRIAARLQLELALFDEGRREIANSGSALPTPPAHRDEGGVVFGRGGPAWVLALPDGRWLVARNPTRRLKHPGLWFITFLGAIAAVVGLTAWPVVRGLTRRLERLQKGVQQLGGGGLPARVEVSGRDEIARLAQSFNDSAARIESLVNAHRLLLANASHELRTPLARVRMGLELLKDSADPHRRTALESDIAELDQMIEEILLLSRLDAQTPLDRSEPTDLLALAAEVAAHFPETEVTGASVTVYGDPSLLRRMIRNLLQNAERHGRPPVDVEVNRENTKAVLRITDHGDGFLMPDPDLAFEPFQRGPGRGRIPGSGLGLALVRQIAERHAGAARIVKGPDGRRLNRIEITLPATW